ncbi:hypothetical protein FHQ28_05325 [Pasteurellaceae bacterium USgator11]|nr:hypothetical protein FHQ19_09475 [Pasteurellaceae bacterium UScroc12]TNG94736.1 hypothetical protein FHQ20_08065 [Pasteurellaceae bacterium USgator41]TNG97707.1 hypothetical protein FHQ24_09855 [Pasteurellaceae bacterium UScroc31]TNH01668.1 hypothetical protein FHQ28_05325 [Pasteurellaceae bacterium USgator11]
MIATDKMCRAILNSLKNEPENWVLEGYWLKNKNGIELFVSDGVLFLKMANRHTHFIFGLFTFSLLWKIKIWKWVRKVIKNGRAERIKETEKSILDLFN